MTRSFRRYVAVGDSFTEGLDDLRDDGTPRGWADRIADVLAHSEPGFAYANLAVRGLRLDPIVSRQIPAAVAMRPDLVTFAAGGNDILGVRINLDDVARQFDGAVKMLTAAGATVVVFGGYDPTTQLPPGRLIARRTLAYNARIEATARRYGALLIDLWSMPELTDRRLWSPDRLHLSPAGHLQVAGVVLDRLGRPTPEGWPLRLDDARRVSMLRAGLNDVWWSRDYLLPWAVRKIRGRSTGDGREAKRPILESWQPEESHRSVLGGLTPRS